jgi:hypothetical protein
MKKLYISFMVLGILLSGTTITLGQTFCNPNGKIAIFSNYDGGILQINVDQNIPNLKIGIVSYEDDSVVISGTYAGNVTQVIYAGFYNTSHVHCVTNINVKGVYGVSPSIVTINFMPSSTLSNPNGSTHIICNTSCSDSTSQGGCNTFDQITDYFVTQFGSSNILFHLTQYGCWNGIQNISTGGNCCNDIYEGISENIFPHHPVLVTPNPSAGKFVINTDGKISSVEIYNLLGEKIYSDFKFDPQTSGEFDLSRFPKGIYVAKIYDGEQGQTEKFVIE